jgi:antitoxin component of MazEF toxin-antitoxin module
MRTQIRQYGGGAVIHIPLSLMDKAALGVGETVDISAGAGSITIQSLNAPRYDLETLLKAMDPASFPDQADF